MTQEINEIYALLSQNRYWKELIPEKLGTLSNEELLLLSEKFYIAIEEVSEKLKVLDSGSCEALLVELRKLEQRVAAVDEYYVGRENEQEVGDEKNN